jgi:hypothetical protein
MFIKSVFKSKEKQIFDLFVNFCNQKFHIKNKNHQWGVQSVLVKDYVFFIIYVHL